MVSLCLSIISLYLYIISPIWCRTVYRLHLSWYFVFSVNLQSCHLQRNKNYMVVMGFLYSLMTAFQAHYNLMCTSVSIECNIESVYHFQSTSLKTVGCFEPAASMNYGQIPRYMQVPTGSCSLLHFILKVAVHGFRYLQPARPEYRRPI